MRSHDGLGEEEGEERRCRRLEEGEEEGEKEKEDVDRLCRDEGDGGAPNE